MEQIKDRRKNLEIAKMLRDFLTDSEMLKKEIRHSVLSDGRLESVAEHVWRMSLLGVMITPYLSHEIDTSRFLKMIIVHDLVEIYAGDMPITESSTSSEAKERKVALEKEAIDKIKINLPSLPGEEIYDLWWEYELNQSYESRIAHALDKIEAQAQHNEAGIKTWSKDEYHFAYKLPQYTIGEEMLENISDILISEVDNMLLSVR